MLTLYQLKQNSCFRCCYKAPYYIKNVFLMCILAVILFIIYAVYFRADGGSLQNALKILKGLNSNTFNYLDEHKHMLRAELPPYKMKADEAKGETIGSTSFFSQCVRINKPCHLSGLAKSWPAFEKFNSMNKDWATVRKDYLDTIGADTKVGVYKMPEKFTTFVINAYHFPWAYEEEMEYNKFLDMFDKEDFPGQVTMKYKKGMIEKLMPMIKMPKFYSDIAELEKIELVQGMAFKDKPLYKKKEQIMCIVDGQAQVILVPHVNRQEVYAGKNMNRSIYDERHYGSDATEHDMVNASPVNFFDDNRVKANYKDWPLWKLATRHVVKLDRGDCIFIPAFHFYQYEGYAIKYGQHMTGRKFPGQMATAINLHFQGNSKLLAGFWDAIEKNILK